MYDANLGFDPLDASASAAGRSMLAGRGTNTLSGPQAGLPWWMDPSQAQTINQAMLAAAQQNEFNRGISQGQLKVQQGQLGVQQGQLGVNRGQLGVNSSAQQATAAYQQGLLQQAMAQLQQNAQQFGQTFGLQQAGLTGTYEGQPTLAALTQQQQNALQQAGLMGHDAQGNPTLAGTAQQQANAIALGNLGISQGALTGTYDGHETLAAQAQRAQQEQARAQLGLNTLQLGSQLSGPSNWLQYEAAAGGARANPLLQQGVASWADMTNGRPTGTGGWADGYQPQVRSLGTVANDFGGGGAAGHATDRAYAGGSSTFNEQGGGAGGNVAPMYGNQPNPNATADALARTGAHTNEWAPGWWQSLNPDQQKMTADAWSMSGQSPDTVLANRARNSISQGFGRAA